MRKLFAGLLVALAVPTGAHAAGSTYLSLDPTRVAPGWTLTGSVVSARAYNTSDIVGLTLTRTFLAGRGEESHALRAHRRSPVTFDGRAGRWRTAGQIGDVAVVDLRIAAVGAPRTAADILGCRGSLQRVRVRLTGVLRLRTGTRFFGTIRRTSLTGTVIYTRGELDCTPQPSSSCEASASLSADRPRASLNADRRSLGLQFSEAARGAPANVTWYHRIRVGGYDALNGQAAALQIVAPESGISGGGMFSGESTKQFEGPCPASSTEGEATGTFRTTFFGWGARTLMLTGTPAVYRQSGLGR
jgi:hypothetical protein